jgi:hypothetical protein
VPRVTEADRKDVDGLDCARGGDELLLEHAPPTATNAHVTTKDLQPRTGIHGEFPCTRPLNRHKRGRDDEREKAC